MQTKVFVAFGVRFQVAASGPQFWNCIAPRLPPGTRDSPLQSAQREYSVEEKTGIYRLKMNGGVLRESENLARVMEAFESDVQIYVAEYAPRRIFVHAGVVGWKGRALVFPGRSFCGKSMLVAALLKAGAIYYSDEYAVFDARGQVHPYSRALSLRQEIGEPRKISAKELGVIAGEKPLAVGAIFICRFEPDAIWRPQNLSSGNAVLALLDNTVAARSRTKTALQTLQKVVADAPCFHSARGEAQSIIAEVLNLSDGRVNFANSQN